MKRNIFKNAVLTALLLSVTSILAAQSTKCIYLIPISHLDTTDNDLQREIISKAQNKELAMAIVGIGAEEAFEDEVGRRLSIPQGYIYGVENTFINVFNQGLQVISSDLLAKIVLQRESFGSRERGILMHSCRNSKADLLLSILNPNNKDLFNEEEFSAPLLNSPITKLLKENQERLSSLSLELRARASFIIVDSSEDAAWHDFIKHYLYFLKERKLDTYLSKELQPHEGELAYLLDNLDDAECFLNAYQNPQNPSESFETIWHNKSVIQNLDRAHLKAQEKEVPVYCMVRATHFPGIKAGLEDMGYTVLETLEDLQDLDPTLKLKKKGFRKYKSSWHKEL